MDVIQRLERVPVGKFHYKLLLVMGLGWLFDAMDTGIIAFVLPSLAQEWGLSSTQMGMIGSIGLLGMAVGAVWAGKLADRFGRKQIFAATMLLYSVATGLCGVAWDYYSLMFFRFLVGLGLGGELPVAITMMSEFAPPATRGRFIVLLESFWGLGWLAAAVISYLFIPHFGWQMAFFIGALPALYVLYIRRAMPESVRYLTDAGKLEEAHAIVSHLEQAAGIAPAAKAIAPPLPVKHRIHISELWSPGFARRTIVLWMLWFGIVYSYYGIFTWLPSLMVRQGYPMLQTFEYVLVMTLAQLPGYYTAALLVDVIGRKATLGIFLSLSALCAYFFGQGGEPLVVLAWGSMMSFFNLGAWGVVYTYTPELYPTRIRAYGSGWAAAVGRTGGIAAPTVVGYMLAADSGVTGVFVMFTSVMLAIGIIVAVFGEETKGKSLDEISLRHAK